MTKVSKKSETANDSLTFSASANEKGITSKEIARVTGKQHKNVISDIKKRLHPSDGVNLIFELNSNPRRFMRAEKYFVLSMNALSILNQWYRNYKLGEICGQKVLVCAPRFEVSFGNILMPILNELGLDVERQLVVGDYRIDFYIPRLKIAIEYDEEQHNYARNIFADKQREEYIKNKLGCKFIRVSYKNDDATNVGIVLSKILKVR